MKKSLLVIASSVVFLYGINVLSISWWRFLPVVIITIFYAYSEESLKTLSPAHKFIAKTLMYSFAIALFIFSIYATFAIRWTYLLVLVASVILIGQASIIEESIDPNYVFLSAKNYKKVITFLLLIVTGFYIGSVHFANHIQMPENSFNKTNVPQLHVIYEDNNSMINREHVYAESWFDYNNYVNDLHNVMWSYSTSNSARNDKEFGYNSNMYNPKDEWKGDIARALLYMYVTYKDHENFNIEKIDIDLMKAWHKLDPVSNTEKLYNDWVKVSSIQKNSNPFIDFPFLVNYVI